MASKCKYVVKVIDSQRHRANKVLTTKSIAKAQHKTTELRDQGQKAYFIAIQLKD